MEMTCPRCGKVVVVSTEELTMHDGVAVCPQCLAVFDPSTGDLRTARPRGTHRSMPAPQSEPVKQQQEGYSYCPDCGKPLPPDVRFCPYCGIKLVPDAPAASKPVVAATVAPALQPQEAPAQPTQVETPEERKRKWTPMLPSYSFRHTVRKQPASLRARIVGFTVIIALVALLALIIYEGCLIM